MNSDKINRIIARKQKEKITMLTCYDYSFARILDAAGLDIILVGDSLANVILGMEKTKELSFSEILTHTQAVRRGVKDTLLVVDMPYESYQIDPAKAKEQARMLIEEAGADAVKIEWFEHCPEVTEDLVSAGIAVMGHIGLTPQTVDQLGGFRVQGKDFASAVRLKEQALLLEKLGVFSIVLECIPREISRILTESLRIPTIGIGAGEGCDGQVLVLYDLLGLYPGKRPRFTRVFADMGQAVTAAAEAYIKAVKEESFPSPAQSFAVNEETLKKIQKHL